MDDDSRLPPPDAVCDGGDLDCGSGLLLIIRDAMRPLVAGGVLEVRSRERSVREDLPAWCRLVGHGLLAIRDGDGGYARYLVRKKGEDADFAADLLRAREHTWQTRVRWTGGMLAKAAVRNHGFVVGQPASFDTEDTAPSAVEFLIAAVGGALATGLQWRLSRSGIAVHNLEVVVKARADDILVFLGVHDEGRAALAGVDVVAYVDADTDRPTLDAMLAETVRRCPVTSTLAAGTAMKVQARIS